MHNSSRTRDNFLRKHSGIVRYVFLFFTDACLRPVDVAVLDFNVGAMLKSHKTRWYGRAYTAQHPPSRPEGSESEADDTIGSETPILRLGGRWRGEIDALTVNLPRDMVYRKFHCRHNDHDFLGERLVPYSSRI
nr:hypothetical protein CFP56_08026 [Quercus suber]